MRRSLLTFGLGSGAGGTPFSFGNTRTSGNQLAANYVQMDLMNSSPQTGTITSVEWYAYNTNAWTLLIGSYVSGSKTFTIKAVADIPAPAGTGVRTASGLSLPVDAGDRFATWGSVAPSPAVVSSGSSAYRSQTTKPTVSWSGALTVTTSTIQALLSGTY